MFKHKSKDNIWGPVSYFTFLNIHNTLYHSYKGHWGVSAGFSPKFYTHPPTIFKKMSLCPLRIAFYQSYALEDGGEEESELMTKGAFYLYLSFCPPLAVIQKKSYNKLGFQFI